MTGGQGGMGMAGQGGGAGGAAGGAGGVGGTGGIGGSGGGIQPPPPPADCADAHIDPGPALIRRLTRREYQRTAEDLLGVSAEMVAQQFPPDEEMLGFDNQAASLQASPVHIERFMGTSEALARLATDEQFETHFSCEGANDEAELVPCFDSFVRGFGLRAWRRPLTEEEVGGLVNLAQQGSALLPDRGPDRAGVEMVIRALLQSPNFLYRVEVGSADPEHPGLARLNAFEIASRLSYLIWQSMPDDELFAAAAGGELETGEQIAAQARRMLEAPRAHAAVQNFFDQWLQIEDIDLLSRSEEMSPGWDDQLLDLFKMESHLFLDAILWGQGGDMRQLFTAPFTFVNGPLAEHYGIEGVEGDVFQRVALDTTQRQGFFTQAGFLSVTAKPNMSDPIHRGLFVRTRLMCEILPSPGPDVVVVAPDPDPNQSTRDIFKEHSENEECAGCHSMMDPVGFLFEHYDEVGRWRERDGRFDVDASGEIFASWSGDLDANLYGAVELTNHLAEADQVQACVTTQLFRFAFGRSDTRWDKCTLEGAFEAYKDSEYNFLELVTFMTSTEAFRYRRLDNFGEAVE